jgi:DNA mismatch endonuclease, patch repair protein
LQPLRASKTLKFETSELRSRNMRAIKASSNKSTELRLRAEFIRNRVKGWKVRASTLPGTPDFSFKKEKVAVFVDGCFWHGCPRCGHIPKTNRAYWRAKITRNKERDRKSTKELRALGYRVIRIWECQLAKHPARCLKRITRD